MAPETVSVPAGMESISEKVNKMAAKAGLAPPCDVAFAEAGKG